MLDGLTSAAARRVLAGATWVSVGVTSPVADLEVLTPRRTAVTVTNAVFRARSSDAWVGGALPLGDDDWVVLDTDPDASGLKLDQHTRNLARQYASEANGDPATSAPGTLRATGFAIARGNGPISCARGSRPQRPSRPMTAAANCCSTTWCAASGSRSGTTPPGSGTACTAAW